MRNGEEESLHDLHDFIDQVSVEIQSEYKRIRRRASEDPGTAGDQGEENWADLLRKWLPHGYSVVTKGRVINQDGKVSSQVDIIVLKPSYPKFLVSKKTFLLGGTAAIFECKTTLRKNHIESAVKQCVEIKNMFSARQGTPYKELHTPIIYGLLAHSHSWSGETDRVADHVSNVLQEYDLKYVKHPRLQMEIVCIADLGAWSLMTTTFMGPSNVPNWSSQLANIYGERGSITSGHICSSPETVGQRTHFRPVGGLLCRVIQQLAWEDPTLRSIADYFRRTNISGSGLGKLRLWPTSLLSTAVRTGVESGGLVYGENWDEWSSIFS